MRKIKLRSVVFVIIMLSGFILRLWGINFGLPYQMHQDEPIVVNHAVSYGSGDLNPHFFAIPPFVSYLLFFIYTIYFLILKFLGCFQSLHDFAVSFFKDPSVFYLLGRFFIGVIPSTLTIAATYLLYRRLFVSRGGALFASAVVAFSFLNVLNGHYIYVDSLMVLLLVLITLQLVNMNDSPSLKNYVLAAVLMGVAIGTKYNAVIMAVPCLMAHIDLCRREKKRIIGKNLLLSLLLLILSFLAVNPYAAIDAVTFAHSLVGQGGVEFYMGWLHHIKYSLRESIGFLLLFLSAVGFLALIAKERRKNIFLIPFPVIFYLHLVFFSQPFPRYVLALIPFLAIFSSYAIFEFLYGKMRNNLFRITVIMISFLVFIPLILKSLKTDLLFTAKDTRIEASDWIKAHIPADTKIAFDHTFFRPVIIQNKRQLLEKDGIIDKEKGLVKLKITKIKLILEALEDYLGYYVYFLSQNPEGQGQFMHTTPSLPFNLRILKNEGVEYVVVNYSDRKTGTSDFYEKLKENGVRIISFSPYKDLKIRMSYDTIATTCMPVLSKELSSRIKSGPALEIYRINK